MNEPLRILHLISRLDGYGGARMLRYLAARQTAAGQETIVAALTVSDNIDRELRAAGATVHVLSSRWALDPIAVGRLFRLWHCSDVDVLHCWDRPAAAYGLIVNRRQPMVATYSAELQSRRPFDVVGARLRPTEVRPGVPTASASPRDRGSVLAALELPRDARLIATAGPLERRKDLDEAIWCFELVRVLHPKARLVIFGDGPDQSRLERYAELVSEPGCVRFPGYRPDLAELLPHADMFWQLDVAHSTPHALLEAMAAGVPVVVSDVPAHRVAVAPSNSGFVVRYGNRADVARAADQLLSDESLARRMGQAAVDAAQANWPLEASLLRYDQLYRAMSTGRSPSPRS